MCVRSVAAVEDEVHQGGVHDPGRASREPRVGLLHVGGAGDVEVHPGTADELLEYRDMVRAALIDYCSDWARKSVGEELPLREF